MTIVTHVHLKEDVADKPLVARVPKDGSVQLKVACRKRDKGRQSGHRGQ
jgi:hypothetical protein